MEREPRIRVADVLLVLEERQTLLNLSIARNRDLLRSMPPCPERARLEHDVITCAAASLAIEECQAAVLSLRQ